MFTHSSQKKKRKKKTIRDRNNMQNYKTNKQKIKLLNRRIYKSKPLYLQVYWYSFLFPKEPLALLMTFLELTLSQSACTLAFGCSSYPQDLSPQFYLWWTSDCLSFMFEHLMRLLKQDDWHYVNSCSQWRSDFNPAFLSNIIHAILLF